MLQATEEAPSLTFGSPETAHFRLETSRFQQKILEYALEMLRFKAEKVRFPLEAAHCRLEMERFKSVMKRFLLETARFRFETGRCHPETGRFQEEMLEDEVETPHFNLAMRRFRLGPSQSRLLPRGGISLATLDELSLPVRLFLKSYRWREIDPVPWTPLQKPLREAKVALVSSAGFVLPGQEPFASNLSGGDGSFREIPWDTDVSMLLETHKSQSFDHSGVQSDPNLGFPIDRVREMAAEGWIGAVNHRHLSFMGSITAPGRLVRDFAPEAARLLVSDGVDVALLVPV